MNLNHRALLGRDAFVVSHLAVVIPTPKKVLPEFLFYWSCRFDPRHRAQVTSLPSLPLPLIAGATIALPSLEEQRRIVDILDRAASIRRLRRQAQENTRQIIPALFIKMFGDPATNPKDWPIQSFGDLMIACDYGTSEKCSDLPPGVPVIRMGNVTYAGDVVLDNLKYLDRPAIELARFALQPGDLLFNRTNSKELVGKMGLWSGAMPAVAASYFIRIRLDRRQLLPEFAWTFFNTTFMKRRLFETARGAIGQSNINTKELKSFRIPVPDVELQTEFANRLAEVNVLVAHQEEATEQHESLFSSLAARLLG